MVEARGLRRGAGEGWRPGRRIGVLGAVGRAGVTRGDVGEERRNRSEREKRDGKKEER